jgi:hypothetical protein
MGDPGGKFFGRPPEAARTRHYYIAAEPELWSFAPKGRDPALGKPLPPTRGVVGDYLAVTFLNRSERPLSMHPHGVKYDKDSEGSYYESASGRGAAVGPGAMPNEFCDDGSLA